MSRFLVSLLAMTIVVLSLAAPIPARDHRMQEAQPLLYRFWRGFRRPELDPVRFRSILAREFMPATARVPGRYGLASYHVVLPPVGPGLALPDEIALVAYRSKADYERMNRNPDGREYQQSHWTIFDRARSFSLVPGPFRPDPRSVTARGVAFDVLGTPMDWQSGHTVFFLGTRRSGVEAGDFILRLFRHIGQARRAFVPHGLEGYLVLVTPESEMAFMNFASQAALDRAMASPEGKAVAADAATILRTVMWTPARAFEGEVAPGGVWSVRVGREGR